MIVAWGNATVRWEDNEVRIDYREVKSIVTCNLAESYDTARFDTQRYTNPNLSTPLEEVGQI